MTKSKSDLRSILSIGALALCGGALAAAPAGPSLAQVRAHSVDKTTVVKPDSVRISVFKNSAGILAQVLYIDGKTHARTTGKNVSLGFSESHTFDGDYSNVVEVFYWKTMNAGTASGSGWAPVEGCYVTLPQGNGTTTVTVSGLYGLAKCKVS